MTNNKKPTDTENKTPWLELGEQREDVFIKEVAPKLQLEAEQTPRKKDDPTAIDMIVNGAPADLKTQETPFFTSGKTYDLPPQYTVTFNKNDHQRYKTKENVELYFWVRWRDETEGYGVEVDEMEGVWKIDHSTVTRWIAEGDTPLHQYRRRQGDTENARSSYLLDLREMEHLGYFVEPGVDK